MDGERDEDQRPGIAHWCDPDLGSVIGRVHDLDQSRMAWDQGRADGK